MFWEPGSAWLQALGQDAHKEFVDIHMCAGRPLPYPPSFTTGSLSAELAVIPYYVRGTAASQKEKQSLWPHRLGLCPFPFLPTSKLVHWRQQSWHHSTKLSCHLILFQASSWPDVAQPKAAAVYLPHQSLYQLQRSWSCWECTPMLEQAPISKNHSWKDLLGDTEESDSQLPDPLKPLSLHLD